MTIVECRLNLRDRLLRAFQQSLHFLHIDLPHRIVLVPHHLLHQRGIRIVQQRKGWGRVPQAVHRNAGFLHAGQEQPFRDDAVNRACGERLAAHNRENLHALAAVRETNGLDVTYCFMTQRMLDRKTGRRIPPDAVRRFASQPIESLLLNTRAHQDLKRRGVDTIGDLLPHAYEWLSPKRLAPGKPVMNVRLSVRRCLRILGVEIVFPEIRQRAIYCPCCAHTETDVMKIVALADG